MESDINFASQKRWAETGLMILTPKPSVFLSVRIIIVKCVIFSFKARKSVSILKICIKKDF